MKELINSEMLFSAGGVLRKFQKNQTIFFEGNPSRYYYQIVSGTVSLVNFSVDGPGFIQGMYSEGECFGAAAMFIGQPYPASAIAATDIELIRVGRDVFLTMLLSRPEDLLQITKSLCSKLYQKTTLSKCIAIQKPGDRIISLLNLLKQESGRTSDEPCRLSLSRQQIADMIGLRVETVIRAMKQLEEKGAVTIDHGKVYY